MLRMIERRLSGRNGGEIARLLVKNIAHVIGQASPGAALRRRQQGAFDRRWGTETTRLVNLSSLAVDQQRARHGVRYQPSSGEIVAQAVEMLGLRPQDHTFIDYGSGKGRICMIAARIGFRRVIGVEFSPELCTVAERNFARFVEAGGASDKPEAILGDAGTFEPPAGPLLAYLYNPFGPPVLDEVIARLTAKAAAGDPVFVCYVEPQHLDAFAGWTVLHRIDGTALLKAPATA